ncbi:MAG: tRNA (guanosine(37)-N1)-methyltransferase TrmD [Gammaproteobacteria bacterium]|nr:tRNA (guanosine(37)-N1)-methyltransferase TrmD [Gammaproteobacteria bacterium]
MHIGIVTLFPEIAASFGSLGVTGRAVEDGRITLDIENPRSHAGDAHGTVDDRPYGGGPGMVLKVEPMRDAIEALRKRLPDASRTVLMSPQGRPFDQDRARQFAELDGLLLVCGRYEGVDERLLELAIDEEVSVGDFVVSGGELPALLVADAVARLVPGVLGAEKSAEQDSFVEGLLDCPHYTRPEEVSGLKVPPVLLSGDHEKVRRWRLKQALGRTWRRRPELLRSRRLRDEEQSLLDEFIAEAKSLNGRK